MSIIYNWIVDSQGLIYNKQMERIGYFDTDGTVYTPDLGRKYGFVDINGDTYDESNSPKGFVDIDGAIYNENKLAIGFVDTKGVVYDAQRVPIGNVFIKIHQGVQNKTKEHKWRKTIFRAAAAVVILLQKR